MMGQLSPRLGASLIAIAVAVALAALLVHPDDSATPAEQGIQAVSKCPLGYSSANSADVQLPAGHPAVTLSRSGSKQTCTAVLNATIWTADTQRPWAEAIAVKNGIISLVGNSAAVVAWAGQQPGCNTVDLRGAFAIPGLIDAHIHLIPGGLSLSSVDLSEVTSKEQFAAAVKAAAGQIKSGNWVLGGLWDDAKWGGGLPDRSWMDAVTGATPAYLTRMDGHIALVNSAAMQAAGVTAATPDPPGGKIMRDDAGQPTGLFVEQAMQLVSRMVPPLNKQDRLEALHQAAQYALQRGVTTVHDMGRTPFNDGPEASWNDLEEIYLPAADRGELPIRVYAFVPLPSWERMAKFVAEHGRAHAGGRLFWSGVKEFADGSLGSSSALMHEPYSHDPNNIGIRVTQLEQLETMIQLADKACLQVAVHAIGDKANDDVLEAITKGVAANGQLPCRQRHRIEHAQHLSGPAAIDRLRTAGVTVVTNPLHLLADRAILQERLGEGGVQQAFGSDWPVVKMDALGGIYAAVCRSAPGSGDSAFVAAERMSAEDALRAHTVDAAAAAALDSQVGSLRDGLRADFVVLSRSPLDLTDLDVPPAVLQTYLDGVCVYGCSYSSALS